MIQIANDLNSISWKAVFDCFAESERDVYFTQEYHELEDSHTAYCAVASKDQKRLLIPALRVPIGKTASWDLQSCNGYGGPLCTSNADESFVEEAWAAWTRSAKNQNIIAAFFRLHPLLNNERWLPRAASVAADRNTVFIDLSCGAEFAWHQASSNHRNMVNKGCREGIKVRWNAEEDWQAFEIGYCHAMQRLQAPLALRFPASYFSRLRECPWVDLAILEISQRVIAGAIFIYGSSWYHYHLSFRNEQAPNFSMNCILQEGIQRAADMKLKGVHLGGGRTTSENDSLLKFKMSLGGELRMFKTALVIVNQMEYNRLCEQWAVDNGELPAWMLGYRQTTIEKS
jgi:hypothetical protein